MPSFQDFSLIQTNVRQYKKDFKLESDSSGFSYFVLSLLLGLQDDEIEDAITDNNLLREIGKGSGHDRGIDAVHIDYEDVSEKPKIYLFNFKYTSQFQKTNNNLPSVEIDKITGFINDLFLQEESIKDTVNKALYSKVGEVWKILEEVNPSFAVYMCANYYLGLEKLEKERFERAIGRHSNFEVKYYLIEDLINLIQRKSRIKINAKLRAINKNIFEKSDGDVRALIVNVEARDIIRIVLNDESVRNDVNLTNYSDLKKHSLLEDAFEDNVRVYLKQRSKINRNIKRTALSDENRRFFYFNNGITITCDRFEYPTTIRSPIIELENIQIVNGSQTIHALHEAFLEDLSKFEDIEILCRIYETKSTVLSTSIAEYTNSQNPVKSRDVRSIDFIQQKLEQEFLAKGLYYERKKNQYADKDKNLRLDAEKSGQVIMAFYKEMPREAKNRKKFIFGERYDEIFSDEITADKVLLPYKLFERIEEEKTNLKKDLSSSEDNFVLYSSYYILYIIASLAHKNSISLEFSKIDEIWKLYPQVIEILKKVIEIEQRNLGHKDKFSYAAFFNTDKPKKIFEQHSW
ncbi:AIPR family protein [Coleofasciculus sp. FACHB-129]|uniref:AIPR family protein n=1 Tax=Cyanophyceae TaxID=3028117 RepID=UPI00168875AC|nr:AIPR family protein [Coleofasciculus sp. FACHB-129]MBD1894889.1 AIPR family protein [Coleofasciculus sp. FACHB-129]